MSDTINLTNLTAAREKMHDSGEWRQGSFDTHQVLVRDGDTLGGPVLGERVVVQANANFPYIDNVAGIVATHNAADVLIEVARAAKHWQAMDEDWTRLARKMNTARSSDSYHAAAQDIVAVAKRRDMARQDLNAYLAKVSL